MSPEDKNEAHWKARETSVGKDGGEEWGGGGMNGGSVI